MSKNPHIITAVAAATTAAAGIGIYYLYRQMKLERSTKEKVDELVSIFSAKECHIKDIALLRSKLRSIVKEGASKLHILSDFDKTLTKYFVDNGRKGHSSFEVIAHSSYVKDSVAEELKALHDKYYPIEMSPTISNEEKIPQMIDWYQLSFTTGVNAGIRKALLPAMVKETLVILRDGVSEFFRLIEKRNIPLLVVSAGLGDVIEEVFKQQVSLLPSQVSILANYYKFNSDGLAVGCKNDEMIHTFNKADIYRLNKPYFDRFKERTNAFVMGDTLGDPDITNGLENLKCILKIGFLNDGVEDSLEKYLSVFDIVLTNDVAMDLINVMLQQLFLD